MNAAVNEGQAQVAEGPGQRLKALRESQDLDLSRVATLLHLSDQELEALEADAYGELPGPVFIQGYLRNYARFLGVPTEPILNAYHKLNPEKGRLPDLKIAQVSHEVGGSRIIMRVVTWLIVLGLLVLVAVWWRGYLPWPIQFPLMGKSSPVEDTSQQAGDDDEVQTFSTTDKLIEIGDGGPATLLLPQSLDGNAVTEKADEEAVAETISTKRESVVDDALVTSPEPPAVPATDGLESETVTPSPGPPVSPLEQPLPPAGGDTGRVVVQFDGASWVKISDASGRFNLMGEVKGGTRQVLEGSPPFSLVLGKAAVARVFIDGREFDITPYTRGNVARLTLDPEKIDR